MTDLRIDIGNGYVYTNINYSRQDFEEVFRFFMQLNDQPVYYNCNNAIAAIQLLWQRRHRHAIRGQIFNSNNNAAGGNYGRVTF